MSKELRGAVPFDEGMADMYRKNPEMAAGMLNQCLEDGDAEMLLVTLRQIAKAFGCHIICYSASGKKYNTEYEQVSLDELLSRSDILSVHAPLNGYTENLMTLGKFRKMKKTAIFLNVARGAIVNEPDLYTALTEGSIAGAGLDVLCKEPMDPENPLLKIQDSNKLIITPHIAWAAKETRFRVVDEVVKNIQRFQRDDRTNRVY